MSQTGSKGPQITWARIAQAYPEFVGWVVQTYGPRHDRAVTEEEYNEMREAYKNRKKWTLAESQEDTPEA